jgi:hypothetical protein
MSYEKGISSAHDTAEPIVPPACLLIISRMKAPIRTRRAFHVWAVILKTLRLPSLSKRDGHATTIALPLPRAQDKYTRWNRKYTRGKCI